MTSTDFETIDLSKFDHEGRYKFLTGTVVPRPIALVSSVGSAGILNAAPFSQFIIIAATPALLGIVIGKGPNGEKDTLRNIRETNEYVINITSEAMAMQVQQCATDVAPEVSEIDLAGLHVIPSTKVAPPRIAESPVQFECRLHRMIQFGDSQTQLVVGEVVAVHGRKGLVSGHRVSHELLQPLGRVAGRRYCRTNETIDA